MLVRTLGQGTFGSVFLADMESAGGFKRRVALKLLNSSWDPSSDAGRRLRDEARLLGRLRHRNVVRVDDLVRLDGKWALVMEHVAGADLEALYEDARDAGERLPPRAVAEVCAAVAAALHAAFATPGDDGAPLRVVHRDIKPSNVRLAEDGEVKVLDFGVARAEFEGREAKTERVRYGSLGYMAPERLLGDEETAAGDVYALGVMMWELLVGETYGRAELGPDKQAAQVESAVSRLRAAVENDALADLARATLRYEASERPGAAEVEVALRRLARELPGDDVVTVARRFAASRGEPAGDDVAGRVLVDDSTSSPRVTDSRALVTSATLALPLVDEEPEVPSPRAARPASQSGVVIAGVIGAAVVVAVVGGILAWRLTASPGPAP
ncbi:MAG: serine/threonine-protein kinase, partial [Myxococcota bacterium]